MSIWSDLKERVRVVLFRGREEREFEEELAFHLEMEEDRNRRSGQTAVAARRAARLALGGVDQVQEHVRDARGTRVWENLKQDVGHTLRTLRNQRVFALVTLGILALGIGANTATFTLLDALLLRTLPVREADGLVTVGNPRRTNSVATGSARTDIFSYPVFEDVRGGTRTLSGLYATGRAGRLDVFVDAAATGAEPDHPRGRFVSGNFFSVLGVRAHSGRVFDESDDRMPGAAPVVVISDAYWQRNFGGQRSALGRTVSVNGVPLTIIGITPPGFDGDIVGQRMDLWIPLMMQPALMPNRPWLTDRSVSWLLFMGRLAPGVSIQAARSELASLVERSLVDHASADLAFVRERLATQPVQVGPGGRGFSSMRSAFAPTLYTLSVAVLLLLLIVCANVANLMLARGAARRREMSIRLSLGAGRMRIIQQLLTESVLLALLGGTLGLLIARWGSTILVQLAAGASGGLPLAVRVDARILGFTALVSILTAVLFGLAPALRSTRLDVASALRAQGRGVTGAAGRSGRIGLNRILVSTQVALSLLLLVGTGMLMRSVQRLENADLGLSRDALVIAEVDVLRSGYEGARLAALLAELVQRVARIPDVTAVTYSENGIFNGTDSGGHVNVEGFMAQSASDTMAAYDVVGPDYFRTLGTRLLRGRDFDERDTESSQPVVIINETMARFFFPNTSPLGRRVTVDGTARIIVGVAADLQLHDVRRAPERRMFLPMAQLEETPTSLRIEARAANNPAPLLTPIRQAILAADPGLRVIGVRPLSTIVYESINQDRMAARVVTLFSVLALLLAALGLYGVMAYTTAQRTGEFGLRMALGARPVDVTRGVLGEAIVMVLAGAVVGVPAALGATRLLGHQLYGIGPLDLTSLIVALAVLAASATLAGILPALRAARVPPLRALRSD